MSHHFSEIFKQLVPSGKATLIMKSDAVDSQVVVDTSLNNNTSIFWAIACLCSVIEDGDIGHTPFLVMFPSLISPLTCILLDILLYWT